MSQEQPTEQTPTVSPPIIDQVNNETTDYQRDPKNISIAEIIRYKQKGLTVREIGKMLGCSHVNVVNRLKAVVEDIDCLPAYKEHRADLLTLQGMRIQKHITDDKLEKSSAAQLHYMMGITYDKERLERDKSTIIVKHANDLSLSISEADQEIARLEGLKSANPGDDA